MLAPVAEPGGAARGCSSGGDDRGRVVDDEREREGAHVAGHVGNAHVELVRPVGQEPRVDPGLGEAPARAATPSSVMVSRCRSCPPRSPAAGDGRCRARCSPGAGQTGRTTGAVRSRRSLPKPVSSSGPDGPTSSALDSSSAVIASGPLGCPAARSRSISSAAAPATCGADAEVPTIARPGRHGRRGRRDQLGLETAVVGRALRGVGQRVRRSTSRTPRPRVRRTRRREWARCRRPSGCSRSTPADEDVEAGRPRRPSAGGRAARTCRPRPTSTRRSRADGSRRAAPCASGTMSPPPACVMSSSYDTDPAADGTPSTVHDDHCRVAPMPVWPGSRTSGRPRRSCRRTCRRRGRRPCPTSGAGRSCRRC